MLYPKNISVQKRRISTYLKDVCDYWCRKVRYIIYDDRNLLELFLIKIHV